MSRWRKMLLRAAVFAAAAAGLAFTFGTLTGVYKPNEMPWVVLVWAAFAAVVALASDPRMIPDKEDGG